MLTISGCGPDNRGEPRTPARDLIAPSAAVDGDVHVYCVERDQVPVTPCSTWIDLKNRPARPLRRAWWLRAAAALRNAGTFTYKGAEWRFSGFSVRQTSRDGKESLSFGWICPGDTPGIGKRFLTAFYARDPARPHGIHSLAAARRLGCRFGSFNE